MNLNEMTDEQIDQQLEALSVEKKNRKSRHIEDLASQIRATCKDDSDLLDKVLQHMGYEPTFTEKRRREKEAQGNSKDVSRVLSQDEVFALVRKATQEELETSRSQL